MTAAHFERVGQAKPSGRWRLWSRFDVGSRLADILGFKETSQGFAERTSAGDFGKLPHLAFAAGSALLVVAYTFAAGRHGSASANDIYWLALACLYLPISWRLLRDDIARQERIALVVLLGVSLYLVKIFQSPASFIQFDELLHVPTANDIVDKGRLFSTNALLPISAFYPGLEIVTAAIRNLTGLSVFWAGALLLLVARVVFVLSLFLLLEFICGSAWIAGIASVIYMAHSGFLIFHAMFAYESFGIMFLALLLLTEAYSERSSKYAPLLCLSLPIFCALAMTHHITSAFAALLLIGLAVLQFLCGGSREQKLRAVIISVASLMVLAVWLYVIGDRVESYIEPIFTSAWSEFYKLITGFNSGRKAFVADDGSSLPMWQRIAAIAAVILMCAGLAIGFFRTLALKSPNQPGPADKAPLWSIGIGNNATAILFTALTLGYPASVLLRLTRGGWEIGNRAGAFVFLGAGLVCAVGIVAFWLGQSHSRLRGSVVALALTIVFIGGAISGAGPSAVPTGYKVSADAASIEPLGIAAAQWTKAELGSGWRFATDRVNRLLLATYGQQRIITTIQDRFDVSSLVIGKKLTDDDMNAITSGRVDYLMVDSRLAKALPAVGVYFEQGEDADIHKAPPSAAALRKFNKIPGVGRPFDNGPIAIYDVRALHADQ